MAETSPPPRAEAADAACAVGVDTDRSSPATPSLPASAAEPSQTRNLSVKERVALLSAAATKDDSSPIERQGSFAGRTSKPKSRPH